MKDLKYLIAYAAPLASFAGLYFGGWASFGVVYIAFGLIPLLELAMPFSTENPHTEIEDERSALGYFDWLLYLHVPILYAITFWGVYNFTFGSLSTIEIIGTAFNVGIMMGGFGINVAHELGHRTSKFEQFLSKALLLPALYLHFFIEHNRGHHKNVATPEDPATSRFGENVYQFWWRSVSGGYVGAWKIEAERLNREGKSTFSFNNEMLRFQVIQVIYVALIGYFFGSAAVIFAALAATIGFLQLETVNYIEHYGLVRNKMANGRYEPVLPKHSWNSNHELGRIFLYELTRHSDHHYKATRKFQILRHFEESPQLPFGYPLSMMSSLVPPLWFKLMDNRIPEIEKSELVAA